MSKPKNKLPTNELHEVWYAANGTLVSYLEGQLLTVIDASISEPTQRKALKDLLRQRLWDWAVNITNRVEWNDVKVRAPEGGFHKAKHG